MPTITAAEVKVLRDKTQLPMMECKKALQKSDGDLDLALQTLREEGKKFMGAREDRSTEEGLLAIYTSLEDGVGTMIELQVESAPVAKNEEVIQLTNDLAKQLATGPGAATPEELWPQPSPSKSGMTLEDQRDEIQNKIREVFRLARIERVDNACGGYVHHDGKNAVLLAVEGGTDDLAKEISMHIVAMRPQAVGKDDLDAEFVTKERSMLVEAAKKEGKPENIIEKMVDGRMQNFFAEHALEEQPFIKDDKQTVGKIASGGGMKLVKFIRWQLGESSGGTA